MIGSMGVGYIVTPHSEATRRRFEKTFGQQMNDDSGTPLPIAQANFYGNHPVLQKGNVAEQIEVGSDLSDRESWAGPIELVATDTSNLSRNMRLKKGGKSKVINDWMETSRFCGYRLIVKFLDEDAEPEVAFVPHSHSASQLSLMADKEGQPGLWFLLVAGASKKSPLKFTVRYRYQPLH